jgi:hypothetical protein
MERKRYPHSLNGLRWRLRYGVWKGNGKRACLELSLSFELAGLSLMFIRFLFICNDRGCGCVEESLRGANEVEEEWQIESNI